MYLKLLLNFKVICILLLFITACGTLPQQDDSAFKDKIKKLQNELKLAKRNAEKHENALNDVMAELARKEREIILKNTQITDLGTQINDLVADRQQQITDLNAAHIQQLADLSAAKDLEINASTIELSRVNALVAERDQQLANLNTAHAQQMGNLTCAKDLEINTRVNELNIANANINDLKGKIKSYEDSQDGLAYQIKNTIKKLTAKDNELNAKNDELITVSTKLGKAKNKLKQISVELSLVENENLYIKNDVDKVLTPKINELEAKVSTREQQLAALTESKDLQITNLDEKIAAKEEIIAGLTTKVNDLTHHISDANNDINSLNADKANLLSELDEAKKMLGEISIDFDLAKNEKADFKAKFNKTMVEKDGLANELQKANTTITEIESEVGRRDQQITDLTNDLASMIAARDAALNDVTARDQQITNLNVVYAKQLADLRVAKDLEINVRVDELDVANNAIQIATAKTNELEAKVSEINKHIANLNTAHAQELADLIAVTKNLDADLKSANDDILVKDNTILALTADKTNLKEALTAANGEILVKNQQLSDLTTAKDLEINTRTVERDEARNNLVKKTEELNDKSHQMAAYNMSTEKEISSLENELKRVEAELTTASSNKDLLSKDLNTKNLQITNLSDQLESLTTANKNLINELDLTKVELAKTTDEKNVFGEELEKATTKTVELEKEKNDLIDKLAQNNEESKLLATLLDEKVEYIKKIQETIGVYDIEKDNHIVFNDTYSNTYERVNIVIKYFEDLINLIAKQYETSVEQGINNYVVEMNYSDTSSSNLQIQENTGTDLYDSTATFSGLQEFLKRSLSRKYNKKNKKRTHVNKIFPNDTDILIAERDAYKNKIDELNSELSSAINDKNFLRELYNKSIQEKSWLEGKINGENSLLESWHKLLDEIADKFNYLERNNNEFIISNYINFKSGKVTITWNDIYRKNNIYHRSELILNYIDELVRLIIIKPNTSSKSDNNESKGNEVFIDDVGSILDFLPNYTVDNNGIENMSDSIDKSNNNKSNDDNDESSVDIITNKESPKRTNSQRNFKKRESEKDVRNNLSDKFRRLTRKEREAKVEKWKKIVSKDNLDTRDKNQATKIWDIFQSNNQAFNGLMEIAEGGDATDDFNKFYIQLLKRKAVGSVKSEDKIKLARENFKKPFKKSGSSNQLLPPKED